MSRHLLRASSGEVIGVLTILGCLYLFYSLPSATKVNFFVWMGVGLPVYFLYGAWASGLAKAR